MRLEHLQRRIKHPQSFHSSRFVTLVVSECNPLVGGGHRPSLLGGLCKAEGVGHPNASVEKRRGTKCVRNFPDTPISVEPLHLL